MFLICIISSFSLDFEHIISVRCTKVDIRFVFCFETFPKYLRVSWIGKAFISLDKNVKMAVESCYGFVTTRVVFTSKRMLPVARKDVFHAEKLRYL